MYSTASPATTPTPGRATKAPLVRSRAAERMLSLTGTTRLPDADLAVTMFGFPLILTLADAVDDLRARTKDGRGRTSGFPTAALIAVSAIARYTGSLPSALKLLASPGVWERCRLAWDTFADVEPLPSFPPERHRVTYLRDLINDQQQVIEVLKESFTGGAVRMARLLGNFPAGDNSLLQVDPAHTIFGDGSILRPMTDVMQHVNELTGEIEYLGSRASAGKPRVQTAVRELDTDHPGQVGINFVAMHTETAFGLITLGVESTLSAEQWAALAVLERIWPHTSGAVHNVVYDGALTGWVEDALLSTYGIQLLQKGRNRADSKPSDNDAIRILDIDARVHATAADRLAERDRTTGHTLRSHSEAFLGRVHTIVRHDVLARMWYSNEPLPVGTSLYPNAQDDGGFELVNSHYEFVRLTHDGPDGPCVHQLVIDDGALFTVGIDENTEVPVKLEQLPCMDAQRRRASTGFTLERSYLIPCEHGDAVWTHTWTPDTPAHAQHEQRPNGRTYDRAGRLLSTIPRVATDQFAPVLRLRNYSESFNNWFKSAMPRHGRAASMTQRGQEFDFLMSALAANALTWHHHQH